MTDQTPDTSGPFTTPGDTQPLAGDVFPRSYVEELRAENAKHRTDLKAARDEVERLQDIEKTVTGFQAQAQEANLKVLRYEAAAKHGIDLGRAHRLRGTTAEELDSEVAEVLITYLM